MLDSRQEQEIDRAISSVVGGGADLGEAVRKYIGEDQMGVYRKTILDRAGEKLPAHLSAYVGQRVAYLMRSGDYHPRKQFG